MDTCERMKPAMNEWELVMEERKVALNEQDLALNQCVITQIHSIVVLRLDIGSLGLTSAVSCPSSAACH